MNGWSALRPISIGVGQFFHPAESRVACQDETHRPGMAIDCGLSTAMDIALSGDVRAGFQ
jgi:hypothetical protein